jgi:hypothetical protein
MNDPSLPADRRRSDLDADPAVTSTGKRPWRPPMEQLSEFLDESSPRVDRFVEAFLEEYGREFIDDLFASYLDGVGSTYRRKLIEFAVKRGIIDEGRSAGVTSVKPPKQVAPSIKPPQAGGEQQQQRSSA